MSNNFRNPRLIAKTKLICGLIAVFSMRSLYRGKLLIPSDCKNRTVNMAQHSEKKSLIEAIYAREEF